MLTYARKFTYLSAAKNSNKKYLTSDMAKVNIKSEKITPFGGIYYASKAFYALFMRFHLTKSSTALLVFAVLPTTATSGTR